jgi:hypothetical protein
VDAGQQIPPLSFSVRPIQAHLPPFTWVAALVEGSPQPIDAALPQPPLAMAVGLKILNPGVAVNLLALERGNRLFRQFSASSLTASEIVPLCDGELINISIFRHLSKLSRD